MCGKCPKGHPLKTFSIDVSPRALTITVDCPICNRVYSAVVPRSDAFGTEKARRAFADGMPLGNAYPQEQEDLTK